MTKQAETMHAEQLRSDLRLLLHMCCAPCSEYPLQALRAEGFEVTGLFANPNIHPEEEFRKRRDNVLRLSELKDFPVFTDERYEEGLWRRFGTDKVAQCRACYSIRMDMAAAFASANGFTQFTTSLLVSPWQDYEAIIRAGHAAAYRHGLTFLVRDFRPGYREGQDMAKEDGLYRQKYCGCIFSLGETSPKFRDRYLREFGLAPEDIPAREDPAELKTV